jgi:hypothetical protein
VAQAAFGLEMWMRVDSPHVCPSAPPHVASLALACGFAVAAYRASCAFACEDYYSGTTSSTLLHIS